MVKHESANQQIGSGTTMHEGTLMYESLRSSIMAPRAYWKGFLRLSLVSCPVALYPATSDQYDDALKDLLRKKDKGEKIETPREPRSDNVVNLMDALRRSVQGEPASESRARRRRSRQRARTTKRRPTARHRKAG